jgi:hypothetical protein
MAQRRDPAVPAGPGEGHAALLRAAGGGGDGGPLKVSPAHPALNPTTEPTLPLYPTTEPPPALSLGPCH